MNYDPHLEVKYLPNEEEKGWNKRNISHVSKYVSITQTL